MRNRYQIETDLFDLDYLRLFNNYLCASPERVCRRRFHHLRLSFDPSTNDNNWPPVMISPNNLSNPSTPSPLPGACVPATAGTHAELLIDICTIYIDLWESSIFLTYYVDYEIGKKNKKKIRSVVFLSRGALGFFPYTYVDFALVAPQFHHQ